ncbi:hypothetical protein [Pelagerythrobacter marinus]|uniref:hypothetical protein n=1 Tax=Pelagerythrobacter marinus TaxID=538382 RepID=UPI0013701994|nr:hypothetical protein [Pelagerythrobacter marinus]
MEHSHEGYKSGHPWYYLLGGKRLSLKEIRESARASGYKGYRADAIAKADNLHEPRRSQVLREIREQAMRELNNDVSLYREFARKLARHRVAGEDSGPDRECADVHVSISLKHNHIYNEFAHLIVLDDLLNKQGDLFDF